MQSEVTLADEFADVVPGRRFVRATDTVADIPPEIFNAALKTILDCRRLDMRSLAQDLGIGRATLYRRVGDRDRLLGEVIWYLTRRAIEPALAANDHLTGAERYLAVSGDFMRFVQAQPAFRRLLEAEPEASLRLLTSKHGPVQGRLIAMTEQLLREEEERGALKLTADRHALAFVLVRIGESFLYSDAIAENETDIEQAVSLMRNLLVAPTAA